MINFNEQIGIYDGYTIDLVSADQPAAGAAKQIEYDVFKEAGYSKSSEEHEKNYAPYDSRSLFALASYGSELRAASRFIVARAAATTFHDSGLKGINDTLYPSDEWGKLDISPEGWEKLGTFSAAATIEVAVHAIPSKHRMSRIPFLLTAVELGISIAAQQLRAREARPSILSSCDENYFRQHRVAFGSVIDPIGAFSNYGNSPTINIIVDINAMRSSDEQRRRPLLNGEVIDKTAAKVIAHGLEEECSE